MEFRLSSEEENLRKRVAEFVRDELVRLEPEFTNAPDIFEGSRWKSRVKSSDDPEIQRYLTIMEGLEKRPRPMGCGASTCRKNTAAARSATSP